MPNNKDRKEYKQFSMTFLPRVDDEYIQFIKDRTPKKAFIELYEEVKKAKELQKLVNNFNENQLKEIIETSIKQNVEEIVGQEIKKSFDRVENQTISVLEKYTNELFRQLTQQINHHLMGETINNSR
ncbi:hypothetical protein KHQ81_15395 (plasmid) [Mycoplasmatota bacterium]|nr:hypothetical protein KHQ81_15395 [Mycoplasmatota bacterium]